MNRPGDTWNGFYISKKTISDKGKHHQGVLHKNPAGRASLFLVDPLENYTIPPKGLESKNNQSSTTSHFTY